MDGRKSGCMNESTLVKIMRACLTKPVNQRQEWWVRGLLPSNRAPARWICRRRGLCSLPGRTLEGPVPEEPERDCGSEAPCAGSCHAQRILQTLNAYRRSSTLTDVVLRAGGRDFPCHRAALSAGSTYFRSLFAAGQPERGLAMVPVVPEAPGPAGTAVATALAVVLDYLYGAGVRLRAEDEAAAVLALAERLGVAGLREACARFLEGRLRAANSLALRRVAAAFSLASLAERCGRVLRQAFAEVARHADFLELTPDEVAALLADPALGVAHEEAVFEAAMRWVRHDPPARRGQLRRLLEHVRLPLLAPAYFLEKVEADELLQACGECRPLLLEARACFILGRETGTLRARPRRYAPPPPSQPPLASCRALFPTLFPCSTACSALHHPLILSLDHAS